jgi:branched-chain amino acid transport system ATP-binding protein
LRIELVGVTHNFGGLAALVDVSLDITGPGAVGLIGPNGSGKSTALAVMSGVLRPTVGTVVVSGRDLTGKRPHVFAAAGLQRTFQQARLIPHLRTWENIAIGLGRSNWAVDRELVRQQAEQLGLVPWLDHWPSDLPAALRRKVQICAAVAAQPAVLLLDEPTAGLSHREASELLQYLRRLAESKLVLVVEHNMEFMYSLAGRVIVLVEGHVVADGTVVEVRASPEVRRAYLGKA